MKEFIKKNKIYLLTFTTSILFILLILIYYKLFPFGNNTILYSDLYSQYEIFINELVTKIENGRSLAYSFSSGLGYSFFGTIVNYLMSPFNLLALILSKYNLHKIINIIVFAKPLASSLTMCYFLKNKFKTDKWYVILFSIIYSFSGFYIAYYFNIMWIEALILLPLLTLGIERLVDKSSKELYIGVLFLILITNYYQGFMLCVFSVLYFIGYSYTKDKINIKNIIRFISSSVIAALLGSFILVPTYMLLQNTSSIASSFIFDKYPFAFSIIDFIAAHFSGFYATRFSAILREVTDIATNPPNVCITTFGLLLSILFIFNEKIDKKVKRFYIIFVIFFILCFFIPVLDIAMQAFKIPNELPYRYSYMYSFILIIMAMYSITNLDKNITKPLVIISLLGLLVLIFKPLNIDGSMVLFNIFALIVYIGMYIIHKEVKIVPAIIVFSFVLIELFISINPNIVANDAAMIKDEKTIENSEYIKMIDGYPFYRTVSTLCEDANQGSKFDYKGVSIFNSMSYGKVANLNRKLGLNGNGNYYYTYNGATPVYDVMFDIRYKIGNPQEYYDNIIRDVYKFRYTKDLMFEVDSNILNWNYNDDNPFIVQNDLVKKISGIDNLFTKESIIQISNTENYYKYKIDTDSKKVYLKTNLSILFIKSNNSIYYRNSKVPNEANYLKVLKENNIEYDSKYSIDNSIIVEIDLDDSKEIEVYYKGKDKTIEAYTMDKDKFINFQKTIVNISNINGFRDDEILAQIETTKDESIIYTSIPYDKGWDVYLDGEKADTVKIGDSLIGIKATKGYHIVYLKYEVPYLYEGTVISCITIFYLALNLFTNTIYDRKKENEL